jgi:hypothetical protein
VPSQGYLYEHFKPQEKNKVSFLFESLFTEMMKLYTDKKNYYELPFYLNYLVIKSNPIFQKFVYMTVKSQEVSNIQIAEDIKPTHFDVVKYMCKHFDELFERYTNYGSNILTKLQMIQFYYLQPPQAKIHSEYMPVLEKGQTKVTQEKQNNSAKSYDNPFTSKLNNNTDIKPQKYEIVNLESNYCITLAFYDYEMAPFDKVSLNVIKNEDGTEIINLDKFYKPLSDFLNNYSPFEFPLFCLNFDFMRILTTVIQGRVNNYITEFQKLERLLSMGSGLPNIPTGSGRANRCRNKTPTKINNKFVSKSVSPPRNNDQYTLETDAADDTIPIIARKREISIKPKRFLQKQLSKEVFLEKSFDKLIKKNYKPIFQKGFSLLSNIFDRCYLVFCFNVLKSNSICEKLAIFSSKIQAVESKLLYRFKRQFFFLMINTLIKSHEADNFYNFNLKNKFFNSFKKFNNDKIEFSNAKYCNTLKLKAFYSLVKNLNFGANKFIKDECVCDNNYEKDLAGRALDALQQPLNSNLVKSDSLAYSNSYSKPDSETFYNKTKNKTKAGKYNKDLKVNDLSCSNNNNNKNILGYEENYYHVPGNNNEEDFNIDGNNYEVFEDAYDNIDNDLGNQGSYDERNYSKMNTNQFKHLGGPVGSDRTPSQTFYEEEDKAEENVFNNHLGKDDKGDEVDSLLYRLEEKYKTLSKEVLTILEQVKKKKDNLSNMSMYSKASSTVIYTPGGVQIEEKNKIEEAKPKKSQHKCKICQSIKMCYHKVIINLPLDHRLYTFIGSAKLYKKYKKLL